MVEADIIVARAFADLATLSIVQHRAATEAQRLNEQLSAALTSRVVIEQAKGVIAERAGVDLAEAFSRLRQDVGIVARIAGQCQDIARVWVHHHHAVVALL